MLQFDGKSLINGTGPRLLETCATPDLNAPLEETQMADFSNIGLRDDSASVENQKDHSGLTPQQSKLLSFIERKCDAGAVTPSYDEMLVEMGLSSKSGIHRLINALEAKGRITRIRAFARSIRIAANPDILLPDAIRMVLQGCALSEETSGELSRILGAIAR